MTAADAIRVAVARACREMGMPETELPQALAHAARSAMVDALEYRVQQFGFRLPARLGGPGEAEDSFVERVCELLAHPNINTRETIPAPED